MLLKVNSYWFDCERYNDKEIVYMLNKCKNF